MSRRNDVMALFDENREYMEERINAGIEQNRKGYCSIEAADADGKPVGGVKIKAVQKKHEFKFGANLFMLDELETPEKNEKYKMYFKDLFNLATLPFYWDDLEPEKGKPRYAKDSYKIYRRPAPDLCIEFCEKYGIEPREHALAYEHFFPKWLWGKDNFTVKQELSRRMREIAERYSSKIPTMEVTNEMFWDYNRVNVDFYNDDNYVEWCFKEAEKYMPSNKLVINEWGGIWGQQATNRDFYYMEIERALAKGARIDAIGAQFHAFFHAEDEVAATRKMYNPRHVYKTLDRYSEFNLPIQITEITIPAYTAKEEDEQLQAELIKTLYSMWFSHKNVEQIIYWNLADGYAAFAPQGDMTSGENYYRGGLLNFNLEPKPAYKVLKQLIHNEWHTDTQVVTNSDGKAQFKGFYGKYELTAEAGGKRVTKEIDFTKSGTGKIIINI